MIAALLIGIALADCANIRYRPAWRQMTKEKKEQYLKAVQALKARPRGKDNEYHNWNFDQFSDAHYIYQAETHSTKTGGYKPAFFPWHRVFINYYEKALQTIDSTIMQPYWDWSLDSQNPENAAIFEDFGLDGDPSKGNCMSQGVAKNWTVTVGHTQPVCLRRCNGGLKARQAWWSPQALAQAALNPSYNFTAFSISIEDGSHGVIHSSLGGECGGDPADILTMYSANDPIFYMHHTMTDKLWYRWQRSCKEFQPMYSGQQSTVLAPFPETVKDVMNTIGSDSFCYEYSYTQGDVPLTPVCSANSTENHWLQSAIVGLMGPNKPAAALSKISKALASNPIEANSTTPACSDRTDLWKIRHPSAPSIKFLAMMDKDVEQVEWINSKAARIVDVINKNHELIDPSALVFQR